MLENGLKFYNDVCLIYWLTLFVSFMAYFMPIQKQCLCVGLLLIIYILLVQSKIHCLFN